MFKISSLKYIPVMMLILTTTGYADFQFIFNDHTYQVITTSSSWEAASAAARSKTVNGVQGYLAHIDNLQENTAIFDQLMANISSNDFGNTSSPDGGGAAYVWIGANDISTEGTWVWVDDGTQFWRGNNFGSSVDGRFNNWSQGNEPDDFGPAREQDAAGIALTEFPLGSSSWGVQSEWNDVDINNNLYYVVEFDTGNTFEINAGHSGAWFNPDTSGQGQLIDVVSESQYMFLAWFTFTAAASNNPEEQHWYTAQGNYSGNTAELILHETLGGQFDDPQETSTNPVGTVTVSFSDCEQGQMVYSIDTDGREGTIPLQRVIPGSGTVCEEQSSKAAITTEAVDINAGMDGAWVDNDTLGQGFLIDAHTNPDGSNYIFVAWFTYGDDTASGQRWLTAQGDFAGSTDEIDIYETTGGNFNDPQAIDLDKVGTMTIDFTDCSNAQLSYSLTDDDLAGDMAISRLIPVGQALCEELNGAE
jgi:hypothetical protein